MWIHPLTTHHCKTASVVQLIIYGPVQESSDTDMCIKVGTTYLFIYHLLVSQCRQNIPVKISSTDVART
jgi:hypothetical protein